MLQTYSVYEIQEKMLKLSSPGDFIIKTETSKTEESNERRVEINLDLPANLGEVIEALFRNVEELAPLLFGAGGFALSLDKLENEGAARADISAAWKEVAPYERLEHAGLSAALAADDGHLRQLYRAVASHLSEDVLQLVHYRYHRRSQGRRRQWRH